MNVILSNDDSTGTFEDQAIAGITSTSSTISDMLSIVCHYQKTVQALTEQTKAQTAEVQALTSTRAVLQDQIGAYKGLVSNLTQQSSSLLRLQQQNESLQEKLEKSTSELAHVRGLHQESNKTKVDLIQKLQNYEAELTRSRDSVTSAAQANQAAADEQSARHDSAMQAAAAQHHEEMARLRMEKDAELDEERAKSSARQSQLEKEAAEAQQQAAQAEEQADKLRQQLQRGLLSMSTTSSGEAIWKGKYQELKRELLALKRPS